MFNKSLDGWFKLRNLHSNMFLLKSNICSILSRCDNDLHSNMFLLKSHWQAAICISDLYLHSNMFLLKSSEHENGTLDEAIYIPICFYLNSCLSAKFPPLHLYLHSNMFLLKCFSCPGIFCHLLNLHSNMFLLKW